MANDAIELSASSELSVSYPPSQLSLFPSSRPMTIRATTIAFNICAGDSSKANEFMAELRDQDYFLAAKFDSLIESMERY